MTNRVMFMHETDTPSSVSGEWVVRAHYIVREAAEPPAPGESVKAAINRAAMVLGISFRRATTFWYGRSCAVLAAEMAHLERSREEILRRRERHLRAELQLVAARLAALEETHEESVARAVCAALGGPDSMADGRGGETLGPGQPQGVRSGGVSSPDADPLGVNTGQ